MKVVEQEESEKADFVVCAEITEPLMIADNEIVTCCKCGIEVQFRPHAPKKPPEEVRRISYRYVTKAVEDGEDINQTTTKGMVDDAMEVIGIGKTLH